MKKLTAFFFFIFLIGIIILGINFSGFFIPLKNPAIYTESKNGFVNDTTISPQETFKSLNSLEQIDRQNYISFANDIFSKSIAHYWEDEGNNKYNITIPFYENWILASLRYIIPDIYTKYEYCDYKKAIERGVGFCSQHAIALVDFLKKTALKRMLWDLVGMLL